MTDDAFAHGEYRRVISWSSRLEREGPWLRSFLESCPGPRIADLGCGSGEHSAFAAELGYQAVGIDMSEAQIESAKELINQTEGELSFVCAGFAELGNHFDEQFDGAICLGNVLPYLGDDEIMSALEAWSSCLREGARLLLQWLNYTHLRESNTRSLPVNIRPGDEEGSEIALVRLMRFADDGQVIFYPTTLELPAGGEEAPTIRRARAIRLRGWSHEEMIAKLEAVGFAIESLEGGVLGEEFVAATSKDVVLRARRVG